MSARTQVLRLRVDGLEIDVECGDGLVTNLVVRAQQPQSTGWGRVRQHLARALRRAARVCDPSDDLRPLRATEFVIGSQVLEDPLANGGTAHVFERLPSECSNGETHYKVLALYEGAKHRHDDLLSRFVAVYGHSECASQLRPIDSAAFRGRHVIVAPDPDASEEGRS